MKPRRGLLVLVCVVLATLGLSPQRVAAVDSTAIARQFNDGLDSRYSARRFTEAAAALGYVSSAHTDGRLAGAAWDDSRRSAVFGFFGHANAGIAQVDEGPTDPEDHFLVAGTIGDVGADNVYFWSQLLPFLDLDDMRLAVFAGCDTANSDPYWGSWGAIGREKGVDSVVGFTDLVYYPVNCGADCNHYGNYFWDRFSVYVQSGDTVGNALSKARADLVTKEGSAGGWDKWYVSGAVPSPTSVRLTPAGPGQPFNSFPLGASSRSAGATTQVGNVESTSYTDSASPSGGLMRRGSGGELLLLTEPPSTSGAGQVTAAEARQVAEKFAESQLPGFIGNFALVDEGPIRHQEGDLLRRFLWRPGMAGGVRGPTVVDVEVDLRTGNIAYYALARASGREGAFRLSRSEAEQIALAAAQAGRVVDVTADIWERNRWTVTVDRGMRGPVPDNFGVTIDDATGQILRTAGT